MKGKDLGGKAPLERGRPPSKPSSPENFPHCRPPFFIRIQMAASIRRAAAGELPYGEKGRKTMTYCHKKKFAKQRYRTAVCVMRPVFSVLPFSIFSGCLKFSGLPGNDFRLPAPEPRTPAIAERMAKARKRVQRYSATEPRPSAIVKKRSSPKE